MKNIYTVDIDFNNAAGFIGTVATPAEAQYIVYFLSHAMMFCVGSLIEAHVVLTTANCVFGERYRFDVYGGTHKFLESEGTPRTVEHMALHRGYNHTLRNEGCSPDNLAILVLGYQFRFHKREEQTAFVVSRLRYGLTHGESLKKIGNCRFYGWGSRRNGFLVPLLINLRRVDVHILENEMCQQMWNYGEKYLCLQQFSCKSEKHGALCPDDVGTVLECSGFLRGLMTTRLIDRPCGIGFLDMSKYSKFLTCSVDDSRDILGHDDFMEFEFESSTVGRCGLTPTVEVVTVDAIVGATHNNIPMQDIVQEDNHEEPETIENPMGPDVPEVPQGPYAPEDIQPPETPQVPQQPVLPVAPEALPEVPEQPEGPGTPEKPPSKRIDPTF